MRVVSSLADIDFDIGHIARDGRDLVINSSEDSTIATKVTVTPQDAMRSIGALLTSLSVWRFLVSLPLAPFLRAASQTGKAWEERRQRTGLNKPW